MPWPDDEQHVGVERLDDAVQVEIDEVQPGHRAEMAQQPGLNVRKRERFVQQRVVQQIDLSYRQVVGGLPPRLHGCQQLG